MDLRDPESYLTYHEARHDTTILRKRQGPALRSTVEIWLAYLGLTSEKVDGWNAQRLPE